MTVDFTGKETLFQKPVIIDPSLNIRLGNPMLKPEFVDCTALL